MCGVRQCLRTDDVPAYRSRYAEKITVLRKTSSKVTCQKEGKEKKTS